MAQIARQEAPPGVNRWLLDTSALSQRPHGPVHERLEQCIEEGAAVCDMVVAESLMGARSTADLVARNRFFQTMSVLAVDQSVWSALETIAGNVAEAGRKVATGDAIVAACALVNDLTVLHYDSDFEKLGELTGLRHEWVVPSGSI